MIKRTYEEPEPYFPAGHFGVTCKRYHGKDETGAQKFWIGVSEFEPDGGADWAYDDNPPGEGLLRPGGRDDRYRQRRQQVRHPQERVHLFPPQEGRGLNE